MQQAESMIAYMRELQSVVLGLSGGVDSCVLAVAARKALPKEKVFAVTGDSNTLPDADRSRVAQFCAQHDISHAFVSTYEYDNPNYRMNPENRCFFCKEELYRRLKEFAGSHGFSAVLDGTNVSDLKGHRPGYDALMKAEVKAPFVDLGFDKENVRNLARFWNLEMAEKPQSACLASRIPTGTPIQLEALKSVDRAEEALRPLGFRQVRVRHHGELARLEIQMEDWNLCMEKRKEIVERLRAVGFKYIALDLAGYSRGI